MVQLRSLMPSVSKEVRISLRELDAIQRDLRLCISTLEILANTRPAANDEQTMALLQLSLKAEHRQIRVQLIAMTRALQTGASERLERPTGRSKKETTLNAPDY